MDIFIHGILLQNVSISKPPTVIKKYYFNSLKAFKEYTDNISFQRRG
jgi:hypothetical protein